MADLLASDRRGFLQRMLALAATSAANAAWTRTARAQPATAPGPIVVSTWNHGLAANDAAWAVLTAAGRSLDAVEQGVRVSEADPEVDSVGLGGLPDRDGNVTLDACIMDGAGHCGSVAYLQQIVHAVSVARRVMERTPHVMLVGDGALRFAIDQGFEKQDLLTAKSRQAWERWRAESGLKPAVDSRHHDTIGMLALDPNARLAGACSTSGLAYKLPGRVGDSPIIGAALFVDDEVGAACATGLGEKVMATVGSFLIVELMRRGATPAEACREAVGRIARRQSPETDVQVGYLALDRSGGVGACSIKPGFQYALRDGSRRELVDAPSWF